MQNEMSFVLKLRLKDIVLRSITVALWNSADILALCEKLPFTLFPKEKCENEWQRRVETNIRCNVSKLALPPLMLDEIMHLVRPIGSEIVSWQIFHEMFLGMSVKDFDTRFVKRRIWTSAGTIDYRKTARELAHFKMLDISKRFKVACLYCLEEEISTIWEELSETSKRYFYKDHLFLPEELHLEFYWAYVLRERERTLDCVPERFANWSIFCRGAFECSAIKGNQAAAEYFFQKLTPEEREPSLVRTTKAVLADRDVDSYGPIKEFPKQKLSDVLCYLLSVMSPEQRMAICNEFPFEVLRRFIDWPRHDHLSAISDLVFAFPPENIYESYLHFMSSNHPYTSHSCSELFQKFFPFSSTGFKKYFVDQECESGLLFTEYLDFSAESAKVVFRNVDAEDRKRLVSCLHFFGFVDYLIGDEQWDLIELCFREATLTKEDRTRLKEVYAEFFKLPDFEENHEKIVFEILDNMDANPPIKRTRDQRRILAKKVYYRSKSKKKTRED